MNRRDIIIIAVLINAGLLVVLFTSALKSDRNEPTLAMQTEELLPSSHHATSFAPNQHVRGDEVDQVLSQFAIEPVAPAEQTPLATPVLQPTQTESQTLQSIPSFLEEAQGFTARPTQSVAPTRQETATPTFKEIRVKKGDVLQKIARAHHTTVQEIMRSNKLSSTQLKIGQVLKIPNKGSSEMVSSGASSGEVRYYVVKNGDNPWTIAVKNQMKVEELLKLNGLNEEKARKLKAGDQLRIR
ncbi:MAG: LysM peptidoglycan-binding domain-containing protein [Simkania sp.]|nr:LysM peptidoglycan-binding domain-containing protein [Simkania sp.]